MDLPIVCTLSDLQFRERRQVIMDAFADMHVGVNELEDGYAFTFPASSTMLQQIAGLVDLERQCCAFLTFKIVVEAQNTAMRLEVTGPREAKKVIAEYFNSRD